MPHDHAAFDLTAPAQPKTASGILAQMKAAGRSLVARAKHGAGTKIVPVVLAAISMVSFAPQAKAQTPQIYSYSGAALIQSGGPQSCPGSVGSVTATILYGGTPSVFSGEVRGGGYDFAASSINGGPSGGHINSISMSGGIGTANVNTSYAPPNGVDSVNFVLNGSWCNYTSNQPGTWSSVPAFQTQLGKTLGAPTLPPNPAGPSPVTPTGPAADTNNNFGACASQGPDPVPNAMCGEPINAATGNNFQAQTDFIGAPNTELSFTRYYNSQDGSSGGLGTGWHSTYHRGLVHADNAVVVTRADGRQDFFVLNGTTWKPDPDVTSVLTAITSNGVQTGWKLTLADDSVETYTYAGQLTSIADRAGLTTTLSYNTAGQLATVTGPFGQQLSFTYDTQGRVSTMTAPGNLLYSYGYGANNTLASVTYPDNTQRQYVYENATFPTALTGIIDEDGNRFATWTYDSQFRATSSQHAGGADLTTVTYNSQTTQWRNGSSTITDADNNARTLTLTQLFGAIKPVSQTGVPDQSAGGQSVTWDSSGFVASVTDFDNNVTTYTHDTRGDQTSRTEASGTPLARTISTTWNAAFHLPTQITEPNRTTTFTYDTQGNMLTRTVTAGSVAHTWTYTYNSNGQVLTAQDPNNNTTTFTYDTSGNLSSITDALNHTVNITSYDPTGRPLSITDANGVVTTLAYDQRQRLTSSTVQTASGNLTTSYAYDDAGNLTKITLPDNSFLGFTYDEAHRLTKISDALGNSIVYTLDPASNVTQVQMFDPSSNLRNTRSFVYDTVNRLHQIIGAANQTTTLNYDAQSNLKGVTDPLNHTTTYGYDALNRLVSVLDPNNGTTTYGYNANDLLTSVKDANNNTTTYTRDGFGQVTNISSPDSGTTNFTYDNAGNLTQRVQAGGLTMNATYDALNRVLTMQYTGDSTLSVTNTYDQTTGHGFGIGRLTSAADQAGSLSLTYDERGNITNESRVITGAGTLNTSTTYDAAGNVSSITYPSGTVVAYARNAMGQTTSVTAQPPGAGSPSNIATGITYAPFGPVTGLTFGNGITGTYSFDNDYRVTSRVDASGSNFLNLSYTYDAANNVKTITDAVNAVNSQTLSYDVLDRLTSATSGTGGYGTYGWTWDAVNNVKTQVINGTTTTFNYTAGSNQLASMVTGATTTNVTNTPTGNINTLSIGGTTTETLTYNKANEMASSQTTSSSASYTYGLDGQRLEKSIPGSYPILYQFSRAAGQLLSENDLHGGQTADYIYLKGRPIGEVNPTNGKIYFMHTDRLGTPDTVTDSSKTVVWNAIYNPFGDNPIAGVSGTLSTQSLRLPGQQFDPETGYNHNGFRDYAGALTRYVQSDPIGLAGGTNTYQYAGGNPFKNIDPKGLTQVTLTFGGGVVLGPLGGTAESGFAFDSKGNVCLIATVCHPSALPHDPPNAAPHSVGGFATVGLSGGIGKGNFCEGSHTSQSLVLNADIGLGRTGGVSVPFKDSGTGGFSQVEGLTKGFAGAGVGVGTQLLSCTTQTLCKKLTP
jgi:RHS repeat-associated protein